MAQARMTAKNTFGEGLIMDFAPDNTQANTLTNALNATLLTYNGNEMSLQNDRGNGRVETAFLPEGYMPMGVCEFGGIIYIVSYNPQDNLCQIGSFPSPERNITKEDRVSSEMIASPLSSSYFQEFGPDGNPTGKLKSLVSKIIIREDALNPGDKYIIESNKSAYTSKDLDSISGLKNDGKAKRIKLSIVSIEDSGKITRLETQNYEVPVKISDSSTEYKNYHILTSGNIDTTPDIDIDAYRKNLQQNYNVFSSRVPGKLAILAELEVISSFSCGHRVITSTANQNGIEHTTYDVYLDYKWESDDPTIFPKYITLTNFEWESNLGGKNFASYINDAGETVNLTLSYTDAASNATFGNISGNTVNVVLPKLIDRDISNFYHKNVSWGTQDYSELTYKKSIYKDHERLMLFSESGKQGLKTLKVDNSTLGEVEVNNLLGLSNTVYLCSITVPSKFDQYVFKLPFKLHYTITPAMDFGLLDHLAVNNEIDFSLIGTKLVQPTKLKYFVSSDLLTLNIDSEIYEEENHKVTEMALEFYDVNGFCGSYILEDRESYAGNTVINIPLNSIFLKKYKQGDSENQTWYHNIQGNIDTAEVDNRQVSSRNSDTGDCGVLYSNMLYGVKLIYTYSALDPITQDILKSEEERIEKGFWLYTNGQFNDYYYSIDNFSSIKASLPLQYSYKIKDRSFKNPAKFTETTEQLLQTLLNATPEKLESYNSAILENKELVSSVDYSGKIDIDLNIGLAENAVFQLVDHAATTSTAQLPTVDLFLKSPIASNKDFSIIEQEDSSETNPEATSDIPEYTRYQEGKLTLDKSVLTLDSKYSAKTSIDLKVSGLEFATIPTLFKKERVNTTILTPVLYKQDQSDDNFNYEEVGGKEMFSSALCYTGSDDKTSDSEEANSDDRWYSTSINEQSWRTVDSLLYEYPSGTIHTNILDGHESLQAYYRTLGNRQPFTLFTIQRPEPDPNGKDGFSVKWTHNVEGPGNVRTYESGHDGWKYDYSSTSNLKYCLIHKQSKNGASEYSPAWADRSYIPAFITTRIANGGYGVYMSSAGGQLTSETLRYTAHTAGNLWRYFYKPYLNTLKELITVNSELSSCEIGTFEYNPDNCKNLELLSLISAKINISQEFKKDAANMVAINGVLFSKYVKNLIQLMDPQQKYMKATDNNVNLEFSTELLGEGQEVAVTCLNYTMLHEHSLLDDFINQENSGLVQYSNGYYDKNSGRFSPEWSTSLYKVDIPIESNKFYMLYKPDKDSLPKLIKVAPNTHKTNSEGHIIVENSWSTNRSSTKSSYQTGLSPIFYNTSMSIDDFTWDPDNKYHHFQYNKESSLTIVDSAFSYQLDDDAGYKRDNLIIRSYYIGPSFNSILS